MKRVFYLFYALAVIAGLGFYHVSGRVAKEAQVNAHRVATAPLTETTHVQTEVVPSKKKKGCVCCLTTLEDIKQKRKELQMWAREMIDTHGYAEGMKRVRAKSATLAKRIQVILEKEKHLDSIPRQAAR